MVIEVKRIQTDNLPTHSLLCSAAAFQKAEFFKGVYNFVIFDPLIVDIYIFPVNFHALQLYLYGLHTVHTVTCRAIDNTVCFGLR